MTSPSMDAPSASPWRSAWFDPRATIGRIVAADPRRQVWLLASLGVICTIVAQVLIAGWGTALLDWRVILGIVLLGAVLGIISLYYYGFFFRYSGRLFGGHAAPAEVRAALAWGQLPSFLGVAICLVILLGLKLAGTPASGGVMTALAVIASVTALWALVLTWLMLASVQHLGVWRSIAGAVLGWFAASLVLLLLAVLFRSFAFQPFNIPSGSMMPTLQIGDYLFVSKYPYGYSHYSLPLSPELFSGRILPAEPQRGDVVVYRLPRDPSVDYISRIVGLPGERIQMRGGQLYINGAPVARERVEDFVMPQDERGISVKRWRETLPNGASHETLDLQDNGYLDDTREFLVPTGHYFMMGDNRDNAADSRVAQVGFVPFENLVGRAGLIFMSKVPDPASGQRVISFQRLGVVR